VLVAGLDVGSDAMSGETVAALRALLGSGGGPLALSAVLAATGAAASVAVLLVALLGAAASGKNKGGFVGLA
jgi:hypothetical protein